MTRPSVRRLGRRPIILTTRGKCSRSVRPGWARPSQETGQICATCTRWQRATSYGGGIHLARNEMRSASLVDGTASRMQVGKAVARLPTSSCRKSQTSIPVASQDQCVDPASTRAIIGLGVTLLPEPLAMSDVTQILSQIESGDPAAAEKLLPLVYEELRKLAAAAAREKPGQTLQATARSTRPICGWSAAKLSSLGRTAATFSPLRPRPCGGSLSIGRAVALRTCSRFVGRRGCTGTGFYGRCADDRRGPYAVGRRGPRQG